MSRGRVAPAGPPTGPPGDDTGCPVLHVDMDSFYASVEVRRRPELTGRPVLVGGTGARSVVSAASYEARRYGVHSAMPMGRARRLCPSAVVIEPDFAEYTAASRAVMAIFREVTPVVEPLSLDEAFLDVAGAVRRMGRPAQIGTWIRAEVLHRERLTCSVGVASTKFIAKLASARCKPDGLLVVPHADVLAFLHPLPVAALWGVGDKTEAVLHRLGLHTVADIAAARPGALESSLGKSTGSHLYALAWGRDERSVVAASPEKSCGAEETFDVDVDDPAVIHRELLRLAERTAARLRASGHVGRTVAIKVRFSDFRTVSRSRTLKEPTDVGQVVYATARELFDLMDLGRTPLRLVGVRVEGLVAPGEEPAQLELDAPSLGRREAEQAADRAAKRFGEGVVRPASLVRPAERPNPAVPRPER